MLEKMVWARFEARPPRRDAGTDEAELRGAHGQGKVAVGVVCTEPAYARRLHGETGGCSSVT